MFLLCSLSPPLFFILKNFFCTCLPISGSVSGLLSLCFQCVTASGMLMDPPQNLLPYVTFTNAWYLLNQGGLTGDAVPVFRSHCANLCRIIIVVCNVLQFVISIPGALFFVSWLRLFNPGSLDFNMIFIASVIEDFKLENANLSMCGTCYMECWENRCDAICPSAVKARQDISKRHQEKKR